MQERVQVWVVLHAPLPQVRVVCVVCELSGVHRSSWHLHRTRETLVLITHPVGQVLDLVLGHLARVVDNIVVNRESRGARRVVVRDHEEVEELVVTSVHNDGIDDCARGRIDIALTSWLEESTVSVLINQDVDDLRIVVSLVIIDGVGDLLDLER